MDFRGRLFRSSRHHIRSVRSCSQHLLHRWYPRFRSPEWKRPLWPGGWCSSLLLRNNTVLSFFHVRQSLLPRMPQESLPSLRHWHWTPEILCGSLPSPAFLLLWKPSPRSLPPVLDSSSVRNLRRYWLLSAPDSPYWYREYQTAALQSRRRTVPWSPDRSQTAVQKQDLLPDPLPEVLLCFCFCIK